MVERVRMSGGRKRHVMTPLFTSYVFFYGSDQDRYKALTTNRLCQVICVDCQEALINELSAVQRVLDGDADLDLYPHAAMGRRCRIKSGPFEHIEGIVIQRNGTSRIVLQVSILGQGAAMEIDADLLEEAGD